MRLLLAYCLFGFVLAAGVVIIYFYSRQPPSSQPQGGNSTSQGNITSQEKSTSEGMDSIQNDTRVWQCVKPEQCIDLRIASTQEHCSEEDPTMILCLLQVLETSSESPVRESSNSSMALPGDKLLMAPKRVPGQKAREMCQSYAATVFVTERSPVLSLSTSYSAKATCDPSTTLVKGGMDAKENEFPHMANIGYVDFLCSEVSWICGGSLVSSSFVLSAAHCNITADNAYALIGRNNLEGEPNEIFRHVVEISEVFIHPDYIIGQRFNDIALFKLSKEVDISQSVRPICLETRETLQNKDAIATGWGVDKDLNPKFLLQKVTLNIFDEKECTTKYKDEFNIISKNVVCAGAEGKDTCQADSGGPLQVSHQEYKCMYSIIGITSFGPNCNSTLNVPGVYTRVSHYIQWIEDVVWPN